jgi:hypothetical protein
MKDKYKRILCSSPDCPGLVKTEYRYLTGKEAKARKICLYQSKLRLYLLTVSILYLMRILLLLFFDLGLYESLGHLNLLAAASQRYLTTTKII